MAIARRLALAVLVAALSFSTAEVLAETTLRVFVGGQQRPDVMRPLLDLYQQRNHGVKVELDVGGATSELQQQYLTTVLTAQDSAIDVMLIDVVRPAQFAAAGWAEPLHQYPHDAEGEVRLFADHEEELLLAYGHDDAIGLGDDARTSGPRVDQRHLAEDLALPEEVECAISETHGHLSAANHVEFARDIPDTEDDFTSLYGPRLFGHAIEKSKICEQTSHRHPHPRRTLAFAHP